MNFLQSPLIPGDVKMVVPCIGGNVSDIDSISQYKNAKRYIHDFLYGTYPVPLKFVHAFS